MKTAGASFTDIVNSLDVLSFKNKRQQATSAQIDQVANDLDVSADLVRIAAWENAEIEDTHTISTHALLVDTDLKKGVLAVLTLDLLKAGHWKGLTGFVPSSAMRNIPQKDDFAASFTLARKAVNLAMDSAWPEDASWAVRWHLDVKTAEFSGGSLGGALAAGVLALLRKASETETDTVKVEASIIKHVAITAAISQDGKRLEPILELDAKQTAAQGAGHSIRAVFNGGAQPLPPPGKAKAPRLAASTPKPIQVADLVELAAMLRELDRNSIEAPRDTARAGRSILVMAAVFSCVLGIISYWAVPLQRENLEATNQNLEVSKRVEQLHLEAARRAERQQLKDELEKKVIAQRAEQQRLADEQQRLADEQARKEAAARWLSPSSAFLRERLPRAAVDTVALPEGCMHVFTLRYFDPTIWKHDILPILNQLKQPFALIIGSQGQRDAIGKEPCPLEELGQLKALHTLTLLDTRITELQGLAALRELRRLVIVGAAVGDLRQAAELPMLEALVLDSPYVRDLPLQWNVPALKQLYVHTRSRSDTFSLTGMPRLERAVISGWNLANLEGLGRCQRLEVLTLNSASLSGLESMPSLACLKRLELFNAQRLGRLTLARMPGLESIAIHQTSLVTLEGLGQQPMLKRLELVSCPYFSAAALPRMPALESLSLVVCKDMDMRPLAGMTSLEHLQVAGTSIFNLHSLVRVGRLQSLALTNLHLGNLPDLQHLPQLTMCNVSHSVLRGIPLLANSVSKVKHEGARLISRWSFRLPASRYKTAHNHGVAGYNTAYDYGSGYDNSSNGRYSPTYSGYYGYGDDDSSTAGRGLSNWVYIPSYDYYPSCNYSYSPTYSYNSSEDSYRPTYSYSPSADYYTPDYTYTPTTDTYGSTVRYTSIITPGTGKGLGKSYQGNLFADSENPAVDIQSDYWKSADWPETCETISRSGYLTAWGLMEVFGSPKRIRIDIIGSAQR